MEQELLQKTIDVEPLEPEAPPEGETQPADEQRLQEERQRARETGWLPRDEFRGDLRKWRDADAWNRHADTMLPIAKAANRKLEEKIDSLEKALAASRDTLGRITKMQEKYSADSYDTKRAEIQTEIEIAVRDGDVERYRELREQEAKLVKPEPVQDEKQTDTMHPAVAQWRAENPWFDPDSASPKGDEVMTAYAIHLGAQLAKKNDPVSMPGREVEFCQKVTELMKAKFPEKFSNPNRQRQNIDETNLRGGGESGVAGNRRTWNDLPQEARDHCVNVFMKQFPKATKDEYVKAYPWDLNLRS